MLCPSFHSKSIPPPRKIRKYLWTSQEIYISPVCRDIWWDLPEASHCLMMHVRTRFSPVLSPNKGNLGKGLSSLCWANGIKNSGSLCLLALYVSFFGQCLGQLQIECDWKTLNLWMIIHSEWVRDYLFLLLLLTWT